MIVKCENCDKEVKRSPSAISNRNFVFCSHECRVNYYYSEKNKTSYPNFWILGINILRRNKNGFEKYRRK